MKTATCPECLHRFKIETKDKPLPFIESWVRSHRESNGTFSYSANLPENTSYGKQLTLFETVQLRALQSCIPGVFVLTSWGLIAPDSLIPSGLLAAGTASALTLVWTIDELIVRLNKAIPFYQTLKKAGETTPQPKPTEVTLQIRHDEARYQSAWWERPGVLPVSLDAFDIFVDTLLDKDSPIHEGDNPLAGKYWYPKKTALFSQREYTPLIKLLTEKGIAHDGRLTAAGRRGFEQYQKMRRMSK